MTDLKPDNTLFDTDIRKSFLIDMGGSVKLNSEQEIQKFII